jgi:hypothetical protein
MSEKKPIFTLVKKGSAYESRHRTPEYEEEMEIERSPPMFSRHKTPEREVKMEPDSPPMFTSPTARLRKQLQTSFHSLVIDAKDNKFMARTTVSFWRRQNFHPAFMLTPSTLFPSIRFRKPRTLQLSPPSRLSLASRFNHAPFPPDNSRSAVASINSSNG